MKDLKHIHSFDKLLDVSNNDLVRQAKEDGGVALGYTCYFIPKVLLNLDKSFSVRMRAPNTGSLDISTYYLTNFLCGYSKAVLERAIEGGFNHLDAVIGSETCSEMNRALEHFELLKLRNGNFFLTMMDAPFKVCDHGNKLYAKQLRRKFLEPLKEKYGVDISDESIRKAIKEQNHLSSIMRQISDFRKEDNPRITGTEFHKLCLISESCPYSLVINMLEETLEELKSRTPDEDFKYRAKVIVAGSEVDDYRFTQLVEDSGALVVADRYCFGSFPGMEEIVIAEDEDPLEGVVRHYFETSQCPRFMEAEKVRKRKDYVNDLVQDFHADGVIYQSLKFCEYWGYERPLAAHILKEEYNVPTVMIDRNYTMGAAGQIRTRVQAFVESLEIKKIQKEQNS